MSDSYASDYEFEAISETVEALGPLNKEACIRVLAYLTHRFVTNRARPKAEGDASLDGKGAAPAAEPSSNDAPQE